MLVINTPRHIFYECGARECEDVSSRSIHGEIRGCGDVSIVGPYTVANQHGASYRVYRLPVCPGANAIISEVWGSLLHSVYYCYCYY